MKHYGDIKGLHGWELEPADIIVGGSPCQDLSVAGKRAGLEGDRSSLFLEQVRIVREMREATHGKKCRWLLWENVPGVFSSNKGRDFQRVLTEIARIADAEIPDVPLPEKGKWTKSGAIYDEMGKWSIAWRIHDAQYWGVPQRRRRVAVLADFAGLAAPDVMFDPKYWGDAEGAEEDATVPDSGTGNGSEVRTERQGMPGNPEQGGEAREGAAEGIDGGIGEKGCGTDGLSITSYCIQGNVVDRAARCNGKGWKEENSFTLNTVDRHAVVCLNDQGGQSMEVTYNVTSTIRAEEHGHQPIVLNQEKYLVIENHPSDSRVKILEDGIFQTLSERMGTGGNNVPLVMSVKEPIAFEPGACSRMDGHVYENGVAGTIRADAGDNKQAVAYGIDRAAFNQDANASISSDKSHAMLSNNPHAGIFEAETPGRWTPSAANPGCNQGGVAEKAYSLQGNMIGRSDGNGPQGKGVGEDVSFTLNATDRQGVAAPVYSSTTGSYLTYAEEVAQTLMARDYKDPQAVNDPYYIVRRITPLECERLQGLPDGWTDIGDYEDSNGKRRKSTDTQRYKALGNGIATPFWEWLLRRVAEKCGGRPTMGSLFDGIATFPYIWESINGKGTALWGSEIDEFAQAVSIYHFPEEGGK